MQRLAPYAATEETSRGRQHKESSPNYRTEFQRDRDRIIHSSAFRRLEYKTQVFINHEGDMFRTRLTHSIEVAQIGRSIARVLKLNEDLTEAIALAHDLGHTPFGHAGQDALNECMQEYGGFEHNLQSLRVVDELEEKYAEFPGLNLTYETREGILKHCAKKKAESLGEIGRRFLENKRPGLEAQLANIADAIAYNNHDIDDGIRAGLLTVEQLQEIDLFNEQLVKVASLYPELKGRRQVHEIIRRMINCQVSDLVETTQKRLDEVCPESIEAVREYPDQILGFSDSIYQRHLQLKRFLRQNLYMHYRVHRMMTKAQRVVRELFHGFMEDDRLLPPEFQLVTRDLCEKEGIAGRARVVADYVAGMTDRYALAEYERIFNPAY